MMQSNAVKFFRLAIVLLCMTAGGCLAPQQQRREADRVTGDIITEKQKQASGRTEPFTIERPADTLRRRLLIDQNLQYSDPASLGASALKPIDHWPKDDYLTSSAGPATLPSTLPTTGPGPLRLSLIAVGVSLAALLVSEIMARRATVATKGRDAAR